MAVWKTGSARPAHNSCLYCTLDWPFRESEGEGGRIFVVGFLRVVVEIERRDGWG